MTSASAGFQTILSNPTAGLLWWRRFWIRLSNWEYWPIYIFNIPVVFTWLWHALKSRNLFFFTLTNPGIETGGFFGESKSSILSHIPDEFKPTTLLLKRPIDENTLEETISRAGITFPVIAKPEIGERGWLISRIDSLDELKSYLKAHPVDFILQTYIDWPLELSIMVHTMPDGSGAKVTSICEKNFLSVRGDGISTVEQLILAQDRALLQYEKLRHKLGDDIYEVLAPGEYLLLEAIGNHCRGTMFLDRSHQIDDHIQHHMIQLLSTMPGVYYGRFDMRVASWESLRNGKDIRVLEFNGASSDPAHIYQPGFSLFRAYRDIFYHWRVMYDIASQNRKSGIKPVSFKKMVSELIIYFRYKRTT
jgi:hypothetical protein